MINLRSLTRSRALQFLVAGAVIFGIAPRDADASRIELRAATIPAPTDNGVQRRAPAVGSEERTRRAIEDEILYREARRLGLDDGDSTLKQHLVAKALLFAEDLGGASRAPTEAELRATFESEKSRFTLDASSHFIHVFSSSRERLATIANDVIAAEAKDPNVPPRLGDAFPTVRDMTTREEELIITFGDEFARAVDKLELGVWSEPIESKYGFHLVKVIGRTAGHPASFEEVRGKVALLWSLEERHRAIATFLEHAYPRYSVYVDGSRVGKLSPTGRLGRRADPSAED